MDNDYAAYSPEPDKERIETEEQERSKAVSSMPIIQDVLDWFDTQIAEYKNPLLITGVTYKTDPEHVKAAVLLAQAQITDYKLKRDNLVSKYGDYVKEPLIQDQ
jgi:hypothetical protein